MTINKAGSFMKRICFIALVFAFCAVVWPTPWRWIVLDNDSVLRINRFTGAYIVIETGFETAAYEELDEEEEGDGQVDMDNDSPHGGATLVASSRPSSANPISCQP